MPTQVYRALDGVRVPSVTTIIGGNLGWSKDALMRWAWRQGMDGRDFEESRQRQATAGNLAHEMVEAYLHGRPLPSPDGHAPELFAQAQNGFEAFLRWFHGSRLKIVATEVYGVSELHRYGGCADAITLDSDSGDLGIGDWKTSGGMYAEYLIQIAAYVHLIEDVTGLELRGDAHVVKFGKTSARFAHYSYPRRDLDDAWECFLALLKLNSAKQVLKKMV